MNSHVPRKRLALLISDPSADYSQSVITGVRDQCAKYDYDLLVFSTMVKVCHPDKVYLRGELNIFNLINYDLVDGVLVASLALVEDQVKEVLEKLEADLRLHCTKPVVSLDLPLADYPTVYTDDKKAIRQVVKHLVNDHHCQKLYILTGQKDYVVSEARAEAFCEQMKAEGLDGSKDNVFYGNFWYTGGEEFANRLLSGELSMPDAVVCANDYMAIGLANRLITEGVKVPEQVCITGYDATKDALYNTVSITTYNPDVYGMAASAVNLLHKQIEPGTAVADVEMLQHYGLRTGGSCGCVQSADDLRSLQGSGMNPNERSRNPDGSLTVNDMQGLHESYMFETLSVIQDKKQILDTITDVTYLLQPYRRFYLVLRSDWSDTSIRCLNGYPETMRCVMRCIPQNESESETERRYAVDSEEHTFRTKLMLPALDEERDEPVVFYFLPSHFSDDTIGFAVLQTAMDAKRTADEVSTLWLRNVNNSLHMVRVVSKLIDYSVRDSMTGLLNRRGMEMMFDRRREQVAPDDSFLIWVIDMDGLKHINDNFGHEQGDVGIITLAEAIKSISDKEDIAVRTGGDEFVIIASGRLTEQDGRERISRFERLLADKNAARASRLFDISASIGCVCFPASEQDALDEKIREADHRMYEYKVAHKKQRND
ncbi:diguanylate cyclase (GGDEF) domain-containing protein [Ruminococcus sp. YRD2003]|uniref:substrate-binding and GGDEF domain-containing protein n=1 Tax=Ruminococcus sp. YRD2003 TaxID=1452313 RepID=UPI0008B471CC|nr:diguanylate cyclase (GGDEF) domain-containing protein [Ruminococcus flavefaciens]